MNLVNWHIALKKLRSLWFYTILGALDSALDSTLGPAGVLSLPILFSFSSAALEEGSWIDMR